MKHARALVSALALLLAVDLALIVVTGERSLFDLGAATVGPWGFAVRALLLGACLWLSGRVLVEPARRCKSSRR